MLKTENLTRTFAGPNGPVEALSDVSIHLKSGEFVAVHGASGCGKSTLLLAAGGLLRPTTGQVLMNGTDPYALSPEQRARFRAENLGFVFQQFYLVPYLNVLDNILAASLALPRDNARERAETLIRHFNLASRTDHLPAALSTGERQRTALARALLNSPSLLLADEPTGNLDQQNAETVMQALADFAGEGGAVLLVSHDPRGAHFATRRLHMEDGRVRPE
jgi:ABC-type lipoprotein export system ATPase subunit